MRSLAAVACGLLLGAAGMGCNDGSVGPIPGTGGSTPAGTGGSQPAGTGGTIVAGSGGSSAEGTGGSDAAGTGGGRAGSGGGGGSAGATGAGGRPSTGSGGSAAGGAIGSGGATGAGGMTAAHTGPFKILMMSSTLEFTHDSIPTCTTMLQDLGKATAPERAKITGLAADSTWTVDLMGTVPTSATYFSEVTADNLKKYELFYSNNPTGPVFTNAPNGAQKKQIFVDYWTNGGSWAGQHSATDFENNNSWTWFQDNVNGGWFTSHDNEGTAGTVVWETNYANHPILKGLTSPWNANEEWYIMNRNIEAVPGFQILAKVTVSTSGLNKNPRPAIWVRENPKGGRAFYTIRGHSGSAYSEPQFRALMLRGILWAAHRL